MTTLSPADRARIGRDVSARLAADPRAQRLPSDMVSAWRIPNFLDTRTCRRLIAMIDSNCRPSTVLGGGDDDPIFRSSESCDMDRWSDTVRPIDESIADLLGIPPENGETMQGQRYAVGQQFRPHYDFFHEGESYWERATALGGQRTWTAMIYLNEVEEGGATWFPHAGLRVAPRAGLLLAWDNMNADGAPNSMTFHEGTEVVEGMKYIVTKWFRERRWLPE